MDLTLEKRIEKLEQEKDSVVLVNKENPSLKAVIMLKATGEVVISYETTQVTTSDVQLISFEKN